MADPWLTIIGIGEDGASGLPDASRAALDTAEIVFGGARHLALAGVGTRGRAWPLPFSIDPVLAEKGRNVVVLASGDPFWFGVGGSLATRLDPGEWRAYPATSTFAAAAAALGAELTLPGIAQSVVLTRTSGRASAMPEGETLANFAATGAVLAIHLSVHVLDRVVAELTPYYGADCPVAVVWRASWPDQRILRATLGSIETAVGTEMARTALIFVGRSIGAADFNESRLYSGDYDRRFRPVGTAPRFPETS